MIYCFYILCYDIYLTTKNFNCEYIRQLDLILYNLLQFFYIVAFPHKRTYLLIEFQLQIC